MSACGPPRGPVSRGPRRSAGAGQTGAAQVVMPVNCPPVMLSVCPCT
jgi:hypothetical protein